MLLIKWMTCPPSVIHFGINITCINYPFENFHVIIFFNKKRPKIQNVTSMHHSYKVCVINQVFSLGNTVTSQIIHGRVVTWPRWTPKSNLYSLIYQGLYYASTDCPHIVTCIFKSSCQVVHAMQKIKSLSILIVLSSF